MSKIVLGIDVSKHELVTSLFIQDKYKRHSFENNVAGFAKLINWLDEATSVKPEFIWKQQVVIAMI